MFIPSMLLKQLYTHGSLQHLEGGLCFSLKNRLKDAHFSELCEITLDGTVVEFSRITLKVADKGLLTPKELAENGGVAFALRDVISVYLNVHTHVSATKHKLGISLNTASFGKLSFEFEDSVCTENTKVSQTRRVPHNHSFPDLIGQRQS